MKKSNKKSNKKYELVSDDVKVIGDVTLYRIRSLVSFGDVEVGDLGGYIESENNLAHEGNCWVSGDASVSGNARVYDDAWVFGSARVYGKATVSGNACVSDNAKVYGDSWVFGNASVSDNAWVYGNALVYGNATVYNDWKVEKTKDILVLGGKYNVTCYLAGDDLDFSDDDFKNKISKGFLLVLMSEVN